MAGYAGMVMVLHALVQSLLLMGTARFCQHPVLWLDLMLSSMVGGLYAGACLISRYAFLAASYWRLAVYILMVVLVFGITMETVRCGAVFVLLNMALDGIAAGLGGNELWYGGLAVAMLVLLFMIGFHKRKKPDLYVPVELFYSGKRFRLTALYDTGNMLTDPLSGQPVLVVDADIAYEITGLTRQQLEAPLETILNPPVSGLRLIPYRSVGQGKALLLGLRMQTKMGDKTGKCVIAFAPESFGRNNMYQALTGGIG